MSNRRFWLRILIPVIAAVLVAGGLYVQHEHGTGSHPNGTADSSTGRSPLGEETVMQRFVPKHCSDQCPMVKVKTLRFDHAPKLTKTLRQRLLGMARLEDDKPAPQPADFNAFAQKLFHDSAAMRRQNPEIAPYSAQFDAKVISQHDGLLVVRLDTYTFLGGAHGMPITRYMVIDEGHQQVLSLDDMLRPGQHPAFEQVLRAAHARWARHQPVDMSNWPFSPSDNVAPLADALAVTYQAYDIAPFATGQPTLKIPYDQLTDILEPRFLPNRDGG